MAIPIPTCFNIGMSLPPSPKAMVSFNDAAEQSALNRQGITENARRVKELEREVAELKALVAKLVDEH